MYIDRSPSSEGAERPDFAELEPFISILEMWFEIWEILRGFLHFGLLKLNLWSSPDNFDDSHWKIWQKSTEISYFNAYFHHFTHPNHFQTDSNMFGNLFSTKTQFNQLKFHPKYVSAQKLKNEVNSPFKFTLTLYFKFTWNALTMS